MALQVRQAHSQGRYAAPRQRRQTFSELEASLNNGVLTVRVPKSERARARRIEVRAA
jgi:HSP20 family molecular chaperone IbpA